MEKKIKSGNHFLMIVLLVLAAILLIPSRPDTDEMKGYCQFAGIVLLVWALLSMRISAGNEGRLKKIEKTEFMKKIEKDKTL